KSLGRFVIIGSVNSYISLPGGSPYAMSKFAVRALADSLFHELKPSGVSCTLICPGFVKSEIRHVDNEGLRHRDAPAQPRFFTMPAETAAKKIRRAAQARKRELVLSLHAKFAV